MTADSEWDQAFSQLARAGVRIRLYPDRQQRPVHPRQGHRLADAGRSDQRVLVGSQNFSVASLGYNRELGILILNSSTSWPPSAPVPSPATTQETAKPYSMTSEAACRTQAASRVRRMVHGHRQRLQRLPRREQRLQCTSNQPDQEATARAADGYSFSYRTNGSGYALVYLNGPPPGVRITVTVGGATCTTSD